MSKVYAVYKNYNDKILLEEAEVISQGPKTVKVAKGLSGFGYRIQIPLAEASFTPIEAYNKYITTLEKNKERLEAEIHRNETLLFNAKVKRSLLST